MDISSMKNMIVLKNLPSNLIEEAIVVLKENKKAKKYQYIESKKNKEENSSKKNDIKMEDNNDYIVKEAENVINNYITNLETKSPKWKSNMKKLEKRYKQSVKLNFILGAMATIGILLSLI